jgi:hypothetical protein
MESVPGSEPAAPIAMSARPTTNIVERADRAQTPHWGCATTTSNSDCTFDSAALMTVLSRKVRKRR